MRGLGTMSDKMVFGIDLIDVSAHGDDVDVPSFQRRARRGAKRVRRSLIARHIMRVIPPHPSPPVLGRIY